MKYLREEFWGDITSKIEEKEGIREFYIFGEKAIQVDLVNKNNRVYPKSIFLKELERYKRDNFPNSAWGELDHPDSISINPKNISHRFVEISENGPNYFSVKAKVLETPSGQIIKALISDGVGRLGISTRGVGSLRKDGNGSDIVQEDFMLITPGDVVTTPSAQSAFVGKIYESEFEFQNGVLVERVKETIKKEYKISYSLEEKQRILLKCFKMIMNDIEMEKI